MPFDLAMLSNEFLQSLGRVAITDTEHPDGLLETNQPIENINGKRPDWSISTVNASNVPAEDAELSSLESFALTGSPEGTIFSSSQESSHSSLSDFISSKSPRFGGDFGSASKRFGHKRDKGSYASSSLFSADMGKSAKSEYTSLKNNCTKFASQKIAVKANFLRLTLLPFLRKGNPKMFPPSADIDFQIKVLSMWWTQLLCVTSSNFKNVNVVDRNAFYEAISALMSRSEWLDQQEKPIYQSLLTQTTNHILTKCLTISNLTVSQGAFAGKVIAYAYAFLPGFAGYFLGVLAVNERAIDRIIAKDTLEPIILPNAACAHLKPLINARSFKSTPLETNNAFTLEQRSGLTRHLSVDSTLFASFFKHFCVLQSKLLPLDHYVDSSDFMEEGRVAALEAAYSDKRRFEKIFLASPGILIILAWILGFFDQALLNMTQFVGSRNSSPYGSRRNSRPSHTESPSFAHPTERIRIDHLKILEAFREILHCDEDTSPYFLIFSGIFDRIFKAMAAEVRAHEMEGCVTVCNIVEEWISSVFAVRATKCQHLIHVHKQLLVDWPFWLKVVERMIDTDNTYTNIRALSFLFNVWPNLPNDESIPQLWVSLGHTDLKPQRTCSLLQRATQWIVSPPMWIKLFCHWSPLVRSYYHRLLCYRLASVGVGTKSWFLDVESANDLEESRQLLGNMLSFTAQWCLSLSNRTDKFPETEPSLPLPRLRVGIRQFGPNPNLSGAKMETNLSKVYMFDIFDSAAYLRANQESSETGQFSPQFGEGKCEVKSQVCRKASRVSRISVESADSVRSNVCVLRTFSIRSMKSRIKKASTLFLDSDKPNFEMSLEPDDQSSSAPTKASKEKPKSNLTKRWSIWNKAAPERSETDGSGNISVPWGNSSCELTIPSNNGHRVEKSKSKGIFTSPPLLTQLKPEITRPSHRFVMIPTSTKPPSRCEITRPFLPFSRHDFVPLNEFDPAVFESEKDLAIWNYGGRSLAEWNLEVMCFEHYANQQRQVVEDTMEMFMMPFLVAEIPWRTQA